MNREGLTQPLNPKILLRIAVHFPEYNVEQLKLVADYPEGAPENAKVANYCKHAFAPKLLRATVALFTQMRKDKHESIPLDVI